MKRWSAQGSPTKYVQDVWTTEKGLPQNTVTTILQSHEGYLWVGTFGGLQIPTVTILL